MTLRNTIRWYRVWLNKEGMQVVCLAEIEEYTKDMSNENR